MRVDEVNLLFTVVNKRGKFVNNLRLEDFSLLDDSRPPAQVRSFRQESDLPLRVALVIDISGSITARFKFEQQAATQFLKKILRPGKDKAFIVGFNQHARVAQSLTSDLASLSKSLKTLQPEGDTALFDALVFASDELRKNYEAETRRVVILISDGENNCGKHWIFEAQEAALRAEAPIYALTTNPYRTTYTKGDATLDLLARYTGGELFPGSTSYEIGDSFRRVEKALRSQYVLSYKPAGLQLNGRYRQIALKARKESLLVQCRHGYFSPTE